MKRKLNPPTYRKKIMSGKEFAFLTLNDHVDGRRKDYNLGPWESEESRQKYARLVLEWENAGRRLSDRPTKASQTTVDGLIAAHAHWAESYYSMGEIHAFRSATNILKRYYGKIPTTEFGVNELRAVQTGMINEGWVITNINRQRGRIVQLFRWGLGEGIVEPTTLISLSAVRGLKPGRTTAPESERVPPVAWEAVEAIQSHVSPTVWLMIQIQRYTGARPGEILNLKRGQIKTDGEVWTVDLEKHKNAFRGKTRRLYMGEKCQKLLAGVLLKTKPEGYLFPTPEGEAYDENSYRRAIQRACDRANPLPAHLGRIVVTPKGRSKKPRPETPAEWKARLTEEQQKEAKAWQKSHRWHPHQLRHTAGTEVSNEFGLVAAQLFLGHGSAKVTDAVYAERDERINVNIAKKIG